MTSSRPERGAVILDRDGVICVNRADYVTSWSKVALLPGSVEAIASLTRSGESIVIATNQSPIGRGIMRRRDVDAINKRLVEVIEGAGGAIEAVMVCPHTPDDGCDCRKPEPGMLIEASVRGSFSLDRSFMVGDQRTDIEAGARAGCTTVLVRTGFGATIADGAHTWRYRPDFIADDLIDAALWIMAQRAAGVRGSGLASFRGAEVGE